MRTRNSILIALIGVLFLQPVEASAVPAEAVALRQAYNSVSAEIDSLVRQMRRQDPDAVDPSRLPTPEAAGVIPPGMKAILVFWADDEARVWLNDYPVGQTRLTPVEVEVPELYFKERNRLRARCWDTDEVESGFLLGLYLEDSSGRRHPVLVSDGEWASEGGAASEITYAHPLPDISGAAVIWGSRMLGRTELTRDFAAAVVRTASAQRATQGSQGRPPGRKKMDYHRYLEQLTALQARREAILKELAGYAGTETFVPTAAGGGSPGLTLGKSGPLRDGVVTPVAERALAWAKQLDADDRKLVLPEGKALKGEGAATEGIEGGTTGGPGDRQRAYRPPDDGRASASGDPEQKGEPASGQSGAAVEGAGASGGRAGGGGGRASRLGLLLPTAAIVLYVTYLARQFRNRTDTRQPGIS